MSKTASSPRLPRKLPLRLPRVCVALQGSDPAEMIEKAEAAVHENPFLEIRLDYLKDPAAALPKFRRFMDTYPTAILIATCRRAPNGGHFRGSLASQLEMLQKAAAAGFPIVDVEVESARALKAADLAQLRSRAALLLSFHDFEKTPDLDQTFEEMKHIPADYYKVVSTATSLYDNVLMLKFLEQASQDHPVVGMCMGEQGMISRVLGLRAGSLFTFASAIPGEETAPGQLTVRELRDRYRFDHLEPSTRIYGVAGDPISHSLSPAMMNAAMRRENINAVYLPLHSKTIEDLIRCIREIPLHGLSITMPFKEDIVKHLDKTDVLTEQTGACNTVVRAQDGRLLGFNTDVAGVLLPLEQRMALKGAQVLVIGAGGAARAAIFGLKNRGAQVFLMNRTAATGQKLAKEAGVTYVNRTDLKKHTFDVIINATPVGMESAQSPLNEKEIKAKYVFDMVYTTPETPFVKAAVAAGAQVIPGYEMFVQQGIQQFQIWTGKPAPAAEMQHVVTAALASRAAQKASARSASSKSR